MKNLYLIRHGQTEFNVKQIYQGQCDSPLTDLGVAMAIKAGQYIRKHRIKYDYCCSSKLYRAYHTLQLIMGDQKEYAQYEQLNERYYGDLECQKWIMPAEIREQEYLKHHVESVDALARRVHHCLTNIMEEHDDVLVVSHGSAIKCFCKLVPDCPIDNVVGNCDVIHFTYDNNAFHFVEIMQTNN